MTEQQIMNSVPTDAPSSTDKPRNNLWTWVVGAFAAVIAFLYLQGIGMSRQVIRSKDERIRQQAGDIVDLKTDNRQLRTDLDACKDQNTRITDAKNQQLLDYLDIKPGRKQTISIQPKHIP